MGCMKEGIGEKKVKCVRQCQDSKQAALASEAQFGLSVRMKDT